MIYKVTADKDNDRPPQYFLTRDAAETYMLNRLDEGCWVHLTKITEADADEPMEVDP